MRQTRTALLVVALLVTVPAWGTVQRTFVSRNGLDTNTCAIDQPCRSFTAAILQTNANGEVVVNDSAGYGPVTITQAVAIISPLGVHAGISVFSGDGVTINAGSSDVVVLRNLYINSQGGSNGVTLNTAHKLYLEHCVVSGFSSNDINLVPTTTANVAITDTVAREAGAGIGIYADSPSPLTVSVDHCRLESNRYGLLVDRATVAVSNSTADSNSVYAFDGRGSGGPAIMTVENSVASNSSSFTNSSGVRIANGMATVHNMTLLNCTIGFISSGVFTTFWIDHCVVSGGTYGMLFTNTASVTGCTISGNSTGIASSGGSIFLTQNTITGNGTGIDATGGATFYSTGDNLVDGNTTNVSGTISAANKS